ncbi:MAG: tRNA (adenosine(37)-N6)-dimethylallyltransferase MiaA [Pseudomonadota bacterium]
MNFDCDEDILANTTRAQPDVVLLAGPTASGKSALAVSFAQALGGEVVNADSMQVYSDLRILSARPTEGEMAGIPHHLFGHVAAGRQYDTARWLAEVTDLIESRSPNTSLIIVGGTGLYFSALERGLSQLPEIAEPIRARIRQRFAEVGSAALHVELAKLDPVSAARLEPADGQRIQRALEVFEATGRSMFEQPQPPADALPLFGLKVRRVVLEPERHVLHDRIAHRFDHMVQAGALDEVRALVARQLGPEQTILKAIGVPEFRAHLDGTLSLEQAITHAKTATRRYAKRQSTWFRNQMDNGWERIESPGELNLTQ